MADKKSMTSYVLARFDKFNQQLSIRSRLVIGFTLISILSIVGMLVLRGSILELNSSRRQSIELDQSLADIESLKHALRDTLVVVQEKLIYGTDENPIEWESRFQDLDAAREAFGQSVSASSARPALLDELEDDLDRLKDLGIAALGAGDQAQAMVFLDRSKSLQSRVMLRLEGLTRQERDQLQQLDTANLRDINGAISLSRTVMALIGIGAVVLAFLANFGVVRPLEALRDGVRKIAEGQIDYRLKVDGRNEFSMLAHDLNKMAASLSESYSNVRRRYSQLTELYEISKAVSISGDMDAMLNSALRQSLTLMKAETGSIMLLEENGDELKICAAVGLDDLTIKNTRVKLGEGVSGTVAQTGRASIIQDKSRKSDQPGRTEVRDALSVPLIANNKVLGVMNANNKKNQKFDRQDLRFFTTLAGQVAASVANTASVKSMESAYFTTIKALAASIDAKDKYTHGHSARVAQYSVTIARQMELPREQVTRIEAAAYLHDIGKIGVPDSVLNKGGPLTDEEFELVKTHPAKAAEILGHIVFPWGDVIPGVRGHHERYDGRGYPDGLAKEDIPLEARIIAVADSFDAMISDRPYRKGLDQNTAITELVKGRETQFDNEAVDAFIPAVLTSLMSSLPDGIEKNLEFSPDFVGRRA